MEPDKELDLTVYWDESLEFMKYVRITVYVKCGIDNWVVFKGIFMENRAKEIRSYYKGWKNYSGTILEKLK